MKTIAAFAFLSSVSYYTSTAQADTFGGGVNTFGIDFVNIGNPGNAADPDDGDDTTPSNQNFGSVGYSYRIGKFEISEDMVDKANAETADGTNPLNITHDGRGANKPSSSISWFEAAKFVNWLNLSSGNAPAYKFDGFGNFQLWQPSDGGYDSNNLFRNTYARYVLPSVDEWYKAAYYDPTGGVYYDYPTGSNTVPTPVPSGTTVGTAVYDQPEVQGPADIMLSGVLSPYGTMAQGGNVFEWEETEYDLVNDSPSSLRGVRGSAWFFPATQLAPWHHSNSDPAPPW